MLLWGAFLAICLTPAATAAVAVEDPLPKAAPKEPPSKATPKTPPPAATPEDQLRRARNEYAYGNYDEAVDLLRDLLYPMQVNTDEQVIEARKYLALSYYLLGHEDKVQEEFAKLLHVDPDYDLDPFTVAPPIIELFETIRRDLKEVLDGIRERKKSLTLERPQKKGFVRTIETTVVQRSELATFLPFGVGQFQNGDILIGVVFAMSEAALLALNIAAFIWAQSMRTPQGKRGYTEDQRQLIQRLVITQYGSAALFGVVWSMGIFHARLRFVPQVQTQSVTDQPLETALGPTTMGLAFSLSF